MANTPYSSEPIARDEELFLPFEQTFARTGDLIGLEAEKFGIFSDGSPLRYEGPNGIRAIFQELTQRYGWSAEGEFPDGPPLQLNRNGASITLEPGAQFELSAAPYDSVHAIAVEVEQHRTELASLEAARDLHWIGLGFHPLATQADLDWVPKSRYPVMRRYLPTRGKNGLDMMRRSATVQANFDIHSERDAIDKLQVSLAVSPIIQALFACSQVVEGKRTAMQSRRGDVWLDVDNDRAGLLPFMWSPNASLGDYIQWALDVPMFILTRGTEVLDATHLTFRSFLRDGLSGHRATLSDWEKHLNTLFPDVRLKRTLEVRAADSVPAQHSYALPAVWAAILYDTAARDEARALAFGYGPDAWNTVRTALPTQGLATPIANTTVGALAKQLVNIAERALQRRARLDSAARDERIYLAPLNECVAQNKSIGDLVLGDWSDTLPNARPLLFERAKY